MKEIGVAAAGLGVLYLTRRKMTAELGRLGRRLGGGERAFLILWSAIFLPGTIIHEVSHFLAAAMTGARTGRVEIFPELPKKTLGGENDKRGHRLGFVETQRLGPVRGFAVGTAPLFVGLAILIWLAPELQVTSYKLQVGWETIARFYLFFTVANSVFLSWADVKQVLPLLAIAAIFGGGLYFLGLRPEIIPDSRLLMLLTSLWKAVWLSAGVNLGAIILLSGINMLISGVRSRVDN